MIGCDLGLHDTQVRCADSLGQTAVCLWLITCSESAQDSSHGTECRAHCACCELVVDKRGAHWRGVH